MTDAGKRSNGGSETGEGEEPKVQATPAAPAGPFPLQNKWALWSDLAQGKQNTTTYGQSLRKIESFDTVEGFWAVMEKHMLTRPSQLTGNATHYFFREGIEPKWEDKQNEHGGAWTAEMPKRGGNSSRDIDRWWLYAVLACVGDQFLPGEAADEIHGIAVVARKSRDRIELWTKTASNKDIQVTIGAQLKQFVGLPDAAKIGYSVFAEKLANSKAGDRYTA